MILVDTNILIDYFRGEDSILDTIIDQDDAALCGIVLAELLHSINSKKDRELIHDALQDFIWIKIDDSIWHEVGMNLFILFLHLFIDK